MGLPDAARLRPYLLGSRGDLLDAGHRGLLLDNLREFCNL